MRAEQTGRVPAYVTTSWDDGHVLDFAVANLLDRHDLPGTFYIAPHNRELRPQERLSDRDVAELSTRFEIGGHTLNHVRLTTVTDDVARAEIAEGKSHLEACTGTALRSFCYPGGAYDAHHPAMVAAEGFSLARTIDRHHTSLPTEMFEVPTTFHAYRHLSDGAPALVGAATTEAGDRVLHAMDEWAIALFEQVRSEGGVFHIWGHSWELAARGDWDRLDRVLGHIAHRPDVRYVDNGGLVACARQDDRATSRVIQLTPYYPPHLGGVERVAEALARELQGRFEVEVWTSDVGNGSGTPPRSVRRLRSVELAHTPIAPGLLPRLLALPADAVVHVHVAQALWPELVMVAAAVRHFRFVAHFHLDVDPTGRAGRFLPLYKRVALAHVLRRADLVIALTPAQALDIAERYGVEPTRIRVLPNGVDAALVGASTGRQHAGGPLRILFVGRIEAQKNLPRLLGAVGLAATEVELVVVGDGSERAACERLAVDAGLDNVTFAGPAFGDQLVGWYRWADVFALSSDREGMPLALLEAMAAGVAPVVTDVSDLAAQVGDAGLAVAPDERAMATAFDVLATDGDLLAELRARSCARGAAYSWKSAATEVAEMYDAIAPKAAR